MLGRPHARELDPHPHTWTPTHTLSLASAPFAHTHAHTPSADPSPPPTHPPLFPPVHPTAVARRVVTRAHPVSARRSTKRGGAPTAARSSPHRGSTRRSTRASTAVATTTTAPCAAATRRRATRARAARTWASGARKKRKRAGTTCTPDRSTRMRAPALPAPEPSGRDAPARARVLYIVAVLTESPRGHAALAFTGPTPPTARSLSRSSR